MNTDDLMTKQFSLRHYNCYDFARDVWERATGKTLPGVGRPLSWNAAGDMIRDYADPVDKPIFEELLGPKNPCIVVFQQGANSHVGVFVDGRVLHLGASGARHESIDSIKAINGYKTARYFLPCP